MCYIYTIADVEWGYLNPARGDKSPSAADLWGDTHSRIENEGNKPSIVYIRASSPYYVKDSKW